MALRNSMKGKAQLEPSNLDAEGKQQKKTVHSSEQLEDYGCIVSDTSLRLGGHQVIITPFAFAVHLSYKNGLMQLPMDPFTDKEWEELSHVIPN